MPLGRQACTSPIGLLIALYGPAIRRFLASRLAGPQIAILEARQHLVVHHMQTWAIAAQKGGVGKTTTSVNLGGALAARGQRVLLVDLDPHASLTNYFRLAEKDSNSTVYSLFEAAANGRDADTTTLISADVSPGVSVLRGSTALFAVDRRFGAKPGMGLILRRALATLSIEYDFCLLDCPPSLGMIIVNAAAACERLIMPIQTEFLAVRSVRQMLRTLTMIERRLGVRVPHLVVPTMYDQRTRASRAAVNDLRGDPALNVWPQVIPVDTLFREAARMGQPLHVMRPSARGALAYRELANEALGPAQEFPLARSA